MHEAPSHPVIEGLREALESLDSGWNEPGDEFYGFEVFVQKLDIRGLELLVGLSTGNFPYGWPSSKLERRPIAVETAIAVALTMRPDEMIPLVDAQLEIPEARSVLFGAVAFPVGSERYSFDPRLEPLMRKMLARDRYLTIEGWINLVGCAPGLGPERGEAFLQEVEKLHVAQMEALKVEIRFARQEMSSE